MDIAIYKNLKKYFDEIDIIFREHKVDPDTYAIRIMPGVCDKKVPQLYIYNGQIVVSPKGIDSLDLEEREYDIDAIYNAFRDFVNLVVSEKPLQKKIIQDFYTRFGNPLEIFQEEKMKENIKHPLPHFIEGHDSGDSFWIFPVKIKTISDIGINFTDVDEVNDRISIPNKYMDNLLFDLLEEFFDDSMDINRMRIDYSRKNKETGEIDVQYARGFEYYLSYNFFTYEQMESLLHRLQKIADMLGKGHWGVLGKDTRKGIERIYDLDCDDDTRASFYIWLGRFYNKLVERIQKMMGDHPETNIISVEGP